MPTMMSHLYFWGPGFRSVAVVWYRYRGRVGVVGATQQSSADRYLKEGARSEENLAAWSHRDSGPGQPRCQGIDPEWEWPPWSRRIPKVRGRIVEGGGVEMISLGSGIVESYRYVESVELKNVVMGGPVG